MYFSHKTKDHIYDRIHKYCIHAFIIRYLSYADSTVSIQSHIQPYSIISYARISRLILFGGTNRTNLSHFWRAANLVKNFNIKKCSQISKDHALGNPPVNVQLLMSSQRGMLSFDRTNFLSGDEI